MQRYRDERNAAGCNRTSQQQLYKLVLPFVLQHLLRVEKVTQVAIMFEYPPARRSRTVESFNSTTDESDSITQVQVPNPYEWLEDVGSDESREFVATENEALDDYLYADTSGPSTKNSLMTLLHSLVQGEIVSLAPQPAGQYYLLRVSGCGRAFPITVRIRKQDLQTFLASQGSANTSLSTQKLVQVFHDEGHEGGSLLSSGVSKSGKYWAYSTSVKGSDWGVIRVKETETSRLLLDEICDTKFNNIIKPISWWGDLGFFYQSWPLSGEQNARPQLRYHALGTSQAEDKVIYEDKAHPGYCFWLQISDQGFAFLSIYNAGQTCQIRAARITNPCDQPKLDFNIELCDNFDYKWE
jgi:prolyl oligopeptidase